MYDKESFTCIIVLRTLRASGDLPLAADATIGSLIIAAENFGCDIIRNVYETSHAKRPQDAAGGFLKQQADMSVLKAIIQGAEDLFLSKWQSPVAKKHRPFQTAYILLPRRRS